jgi:hypothetical protein
MPESTRKRSAAKAAAEPETAPPAKAAKAAKASKAAEPGKASTAARPGNAAPEPATAAPAEPAPAKKAAKPAKSAKAETPVVKEPVAAAEEDAGTDEADEFLNRAARRAKGRGRSGGAQPVTGRGSSFSGRGSVPGQRQWGNRRTGG